MERKTLDDLDAALSLLPGPEARRAKEHVLSTYASAPARSVRLAWVDFERGARFLRGGAMDVVDHTTRVVDDPRDPAIADLVAAAKSPLARPGAMLPLDKRARRFAWFLPFTEPDPDRPPELHVRAVALDEAVFRHVIELFDPRLELSPMELRVVFQVTAGGSIKEAASGDGVAFETKRAQFKSACSKLGCEGQKDVVRAMLGRLAWLLSLTSGDVGGARVLEAFVGRHLAGEVSLRTRRLSNGRLARVLECGPRKGRPLLLLHGLMFPISLVGLASTLDALGLRAILPVRPGYLEDRSTNRLFGSVDLIEEALEDIALFVIEDGLAPLHTVGLSFGAVFATRYAERNPSLVEALTLVSTNLASGGRGADPSHTFYNGLKSLASDPVLFRLVNAEYTQHYADRTVGRRILGRLFDNCASDLAVMDGETTGVSAYPMFADLYGASLAGAAADFAFVMTSWHTEIGAIARPVTFVHGENDPLTRIDQLGVDELGVRRVVVPDGGHFVSVSHREAVWQAIADAGR